MRLSAIWYRCILFNVYNFLQTYKMGLIHFTNLTYLHASNYAHYIPKSALIFLYIVILPDVTEWHNYHCLTANFTLSYTIVCLMTPAYINIEI